MGAPVGGDDTSLVDHLFLNRNEAGALNDLQAIVVDPWHHRAREPAGDAAHEVGEIFRTLGGVLIGDTPLSDVGVTPLGVEQCFAVSPQ